MYAEEDDDHLQEVEQEDDEETLLKRVIESSGSHDFSLNYLQKDASAEGKRLNELQRLRRENPLYIEDHDFLYRLITINTTLDTGSNGAVSSAATCAASADAPTPIGDKTIDEVADDVKLFLQGPSCTDPFVPHTLQLYYTKDRTDSIAHPAVANTIRETFTCVICLNLMFDPTTLPCGHSGCLTCMKTALRSKPKASRECPVCKKRTDIDPNNGLCVSIAMRESMKQLFPNAYGKNDNDSLDHEMILDQVSSMFGLRYSRDATTNGEKDQEVNILTQMHLSNQNRLYSLESIALAYRIKKEHALMTNMAYCRFNHDGRELLMDEISNQSLLGKELFSTLPMTIFTSLISPLNAFTNHYQLQTKRFEPFMRFLREQRKNLHYIDHRNAHETGELSKEKLQLYLPKHQLRRCFRIVGVMFETYSNYSDDVHENDVEDIEHDVFDFVRRIICWETFFPRIINLIDHAAPTMPSHAENVSQIASKTKLVMVDDLLRAIQLNDQCKPVYGFGYPGVPRAIFGNIIMQMLNNVSDDDARVGIDEIALSVLNDMIIDFLVNVVRTAKGLAKQVPLNQAVMSDDPAMKGQAVCYVESNLQCITVTVNNVDIGNAAEQAHSSSAASSVSGDIIERQLPWKFKIYYPQVSSIGITESYQKKRSASVMLNEANAATKDSIPMFNHTVDHSLTTMITLTTIKSAVLMLFAKNDYITNSMLLRIDKVVETFREEWVTNNSNILNKIATSQFIKFQPTLVLFILQLVPEFNLEQSSFAMTDEALLALSAVVQVLTKGLLIDPLTALTTASKGISVFTISLVIYTNYHLREWFGNSIIRNYRNDDLYVLPRNETLRMPSHLQNRKAREHLSEFVIRIYDKAIQRPIFISPFTGEFYSRDSKKPLEVLTAMAAYSSATKNNEFDDDNIFHRKIRALDAIKKIEEKQGVHKSKEFEKLTKIPESLWTMREYEIMLSRWNTLPIFDVEAIHSLCSYSYQQQFGNNSSKVLHLSMEACELIGVLLENHILEKVKKGYQSAIVRNQDYMLKVKHFNGVS